MAAESAVASPSARLSGRTNKPLTKRYILRGSAPPTRAPHQPWCKRYYIFVRTVREIWVNMNTFRNHENDDSDVQSSGACAEQPPSPLSQTVAHERRDRGNGRHRDTKGHAYERALIRKWFRDHQTDPMTGESLPTTELYDDCDMLEHCNAHRSRVAANV